MRTGILAGALWVSGLFAHGACSAETLYNGIIVPNEWPPRLAEFPTSVEKDPVIPPYLVSPPEVISIDVGRQLFVDDFLIADTTLTRTFHLPKYHPAKCTLPRWAPMAKSISADSDCVTTPAAVSAGMIPTQKR